MKKAYHIYDLETSGLDFKSIWCDAGRGRESDAIAQFSTRGIVSKISIPEKLPPLWLAIQI